VLVRRSPAAQAVFEQALAQVAGLDERLLATLGAGPEEEALTLALGKLLRAFDGLSRVTQ
ncbi:MarR family transcriptional regulator, partial [Pseudomonas aeruginosa]|nr:MarR family transcriptional regulator [Pseudomonas aeruginosa]